MIKIEELYKGDLSLLPAEHRNNLTHLAGVMTHARNAFGFPMIVTSGYRTKADHERIYKGTPKSKIPWGSAHLSGCACDISDPKGRVWEFFEENFEFLKDMGLWLEDPRWTKNWVHFQTVPPKSGSRIFVPNSSKPTAPDRWSGVYDKTLYD
jgi:hypothetical protein